MRFIVEVADLESDNPRTDTLYGIFTFDEMIAELKELHHLGYIEAQGWRVKTYTIQPTTTSAQQILKQALRRDEDAR